MQLRVSSWLTGSLLCAVVFGALLVCACGRAPLAQTAGVQSASAAPTQPTLAPVAATPTPAPLKLPLVAPKLVINKSQRQLELYADGRVVRTYRVALGLSPVDDKVRARDYRTPEGDFYVCMKNERSQFYLSLGLSYPNAEDAERGLRDGLITRAQRDRIVQAISRRARPPWDTALGGEIMIHGGGTGSDWTWGCVALANADIKELFDALPLGTPVRIEH